jgi:hypothetical protein
MLIIFFILFYINSLWNQILFLSLIIERQTIRRYSKGIGRYTPTYLYKLYGYEQKKRGIATSHFHL